MSRDLTGGNTTQWAITSQQGNLAENTLIGLLEDPDRHSKMYAMNMTGNSVIILPLAGANGTSTMTPVQRLMSSTTTFPRYPGVERNTRGSQPDFTTTNTSLLESLFPGRGLKSAGVEVKFNREVYHYGSVYIESSKRTRAYGGWRDSESSALGTDADLFAFGLGHEGDLRAYCVCRTVDVAEWLRLNTDQHRPAGNLVGTRNPTKGLRTELSIIVDLPAAIRRYRAPEPTDIPVIVSALEVHTCPCGVDGVSRTGTFTCTPCKRSQ